GQLLVVALDMSLYGLSLFSVYNVLFILLGTTYLLTCLSVWTFRELHHQIRHCLATTSWKPVVPLARQTGYYFIIHQRLTRLILQMDRHCLSYILFIIIMLNIIFNVYCLSTIILIPGSIPLVDLLGMLAIVVGEVAV